MKTAPNKLDFMWYAVPNMKSRLHYIPIAAPRFLYGFIKLYVVILNWLS